MGISVLVLGFSGSGKTASLRNFEEGEAGVFNPLNKRAPFKGGAKTCNTRDYDLIEATIKRNAMRAYVIDDANYLMALQNFDFVDERGYDKYVRMARNFEHLLEVAANETDDDTVVYFMMHPDFYENGRMKPKTIGRMLDEKLCVEGTATMTVQAVYDEDGFGFLVAPQPNSPVKTPMGMFDAQRIDNDLKALDAAIRGYYAMKPLAKQAKTTKADKKAGA